jgi:TrmH family RNA methyltransferase
VNSSLNSINFPKFRSIISSKKNEKIKRVTKFVKNGCKDDPFTIVDSSREIIRAINNGIKPLELYYSPELIRTEMSVEVINKLADRSVQFFELKKDVFESIAYKNNPDGVLLIAEFEIGALDQISLKDDTTILILDGIEKPGNLGALLRTADGAGTDYVVMTNCVVNYKNPNVVRSSTGTIFKGNLLLADEEELLEYLSRNNFLSICGSPHAKKIYHQVKYDGRVAIAVGSEAFGLSKSLESRCSESITIPMKGYADSLNVNQAATIILYEILKQRT